jgi:SsrA-binding protein
MSEESTRNIAKNRKAFHRYQVEDSYESGIVLLGTEVKALRQGNVQIQEAYVEVKGSEAWLKNLYIGPYDFGNIHNHEPMRERKLLLHHRQIVKLSDQVARKGMTLIPLSLYFKRGLVKLSLGLCRGKSFGDKRQDLKEKQQAIEVQRAIRHHGRE